jgi:serine/threonine protein kinase
MVAQIIRPPPFEQLTQTPKMVLALLRRMLEKRPEDRFQTPEELQEATEVAARGLSEDFTAVPERIVPEPLSLAREAPSSGGRQQVEPVVLQASEAPALDTYLTVKDGSLLEGRYRLVAEEREGNGGRLFQAQDQRAPAGQPPVVAIKLLHPGIVADPMLLDALENELGVLRNANHPNFINYYRLERGAAGPYLVREWVHGFSLSDLLRWRRSLKFSELVAFLDLLAPALDFVAGQGLGLVDVSVRKLFLACPETIQEFESLAKGDARDWHRCTLKLNPMSLAPLLFKSRNGWDRQSEPQPSRRKQLIFLPSL